MIALKLVHLIERHSEELAHSLIHKIENSPKCAELKKVPRKEIESRAFEVYQCLSDWLLNKTEYDIERTYVALGSHRCRQGIAFNNVFWGIILTKENLWDFLQRECLEENALELHSEFELLRMLDQFFDRALYYVAVGYCHTQQELINERRYAYV
jgi:hypothetical protein